MIFFSESFKTFFAKIKKFIWILGLHAFSLILFFILFDLIYGGLIFYKYIFLAEKAVGTVSGNVIKFNERAYEKVIAELLSREQSSVGSLFGVEIEISE